LDFLQTEAGVAGKIEAVSFDLWDTIVVDDSDEAIRAERGLRSKRLERRHVTWEALDAQAPIPLDTVTLAYDCVESAFNKVWHDQHVTWTIGERIDVLLQGLGRTLPSSARANVIEAHATMEVEIPPLLIEGAAAALADLATRYRLCIVSDAVVTPGTGLRQILERYGLLGYFEAFAFSDEVGRSKPDRRGFAAVADQLGLSLEQIVHIGDRQHNDIAGPQALGMKAVLFTAAKDRHGDDHTADARCERYADLPHIIDALSA
jgi:putative hydrolase of the HAD superfamily